MPLISNQFVKISEISSDPLIPLLLLMGGHRVVVNMLWMQFQAIHTRFVSTIMRLLPVHMRFT
jgi:hypothetical protein